MHEQVIIDNMMNLEVRTVSVREATFNLTCSLTLQVLFASEKLTGNHTLRDIAISHADKTMANHVRADGSRILHFHVVLRVLTPHIGGTFHVVEYNATTGVVIARHTAQGYADNR